MLVDAAMHSLVKGCYCPGQFADTKPHVIITNLRAIGRVIFELKQMDRRVPSPDADSSIYISLLHVSDPCKSY